MYVSTLTCRIGHTMHPDKLDLFWYYINERHLIYHKRNTLQEPWPWTEDPVLQRYSFCNVYRELDKVTVWIRENWREPYAEDPRLFFNMCVARQFNWPPTLDFLGYMQHDAGVADIKADTGVWHVDQVISDLSYFKDEVGKVFTGAYMLTGTIKDDEGNTLPKIVQVVKYILDPIWQDEEQYAPVPGDTLEGAWKRLKEANGFGPFLAYEVVTDLRHTRYLRDAPDISTWANPGPGAMRGINRLHGLEPEPNRQFDDAYYIECMQQLLAMTPNRLGDHFQDYPALEMREIEHSLCEYDKWSRAHNGESKRIRKRFIPPHER